MWLKLPVKFFINKYYHSILKYFCQAQEYIRHLKLKWYLPSENENRDDEKVVCVEPP